MAGIPSWSIKIDQGPLHTTHNSSLDSSNLLDKPQTDQADFASPPSYRKEKIIPVAKSFEAASISSTVEVSDDMIQRYYRTSEDDAAISPTIKLTRERGRERAMNDKLLPQVPIMFSGGQTVTTTQWDPDDSAPSPVVRARDADKKKYSAGISKLPQFRQSKRWAKQYYVSPPSPPLPNLDYLPDPYQEQSMRQNSFEQQRAEWRPVADSSKADSPETGQILGDGDSLSQDQGLCRPASVPCWSAVKVVRILGPHTAPSHWLKRKGANQRLTSTRSKEVDIKDALNAGPLPRKFRGKSRIRPQRGVDHPKKRIVPTANEGIVDLDAISALPVIEKRPSSPIPSLHDPLKDLRFSQECEAILSGNKEFDEDWLLLPDQLSGKLAAPFKTQKEEKPPPVPSKATQFFDSAEESEHSPVKTTSETSAATTLVPALTITDAGDSERKSGAPVPPARKSSKGGPGLASIAQMTMPAGKPRLNGFKDSSLMAISDARDAPSDPTLKFVSRWNKTILRMPSSNLKVDRPLHSAASIDTLAMIESQVPANVQASVIQKLKEKTAFIVPEPRPAGPAGTPPERPLPDLPLFDDEDAQRPSLDSRASRHLKAMSGHADAQSQAVAGCAVQQAAESVRFSRPPSMGRAKQVAAAKGLSVTPPADTSVKALRSPPLLSANSTYSQASKKSTTSKVNRPFMRHNMSDFRADRIRDLKRRIKEDLVSDRERRMGGESETKSAAASNDAGISLSASLGVSTLDSQLSQDQLEQFPQVPLSRPESLVCATAVKCHDRSRSHHVKQPSRSNSILRRPNSAYRSTRQVLGQSDIKVLVDTNPVTGKFRASAMTPPTSLSSRSNSPVKATSGVAMTGLHDITSSSDDAKPGRKQKLSLSSIKSQASSRVSITSIKHTRRKSIGNVSNRGSDDEEGPLIRAHPSAKHAPGTKMRRRWNSSDIQTVQMLCEDLEDYYTTLMKQEEELRRQAEEIQMMVRVFAPISRAHGLKQAMFKAEQPPYSVRLDGQDGVIVTQIASKALTGHASPSMAHKRTSQLVLRPLSNASSIFTMAHTSHTSIGAADEAFMSDPFEYELTTLSKPTSTTTTATTRKVASIPAIRGTPSNTVKPLYKPPPITKRVPRRNLSEQMSLSSRLSSEIESLESIAESRRLSVNHVLTSTEQMDRAIDMLQSFG